MTEICTLYKSTLIAGNNNDEMCNLNLSSTEFSPYYTKNLLMPSYSGCIYISDFDHKISMNGIKNDKIDVITSKTNDTNQYITFTSSSTTFLNNL